MANCFHLSGFVVLACCATFCSFHADGFCEDEESEGVSILQLGGARGLHRRVGMGMSGSSSSSADQGRLASDRAQARMGMGMGQRSFAQTNRRTSDFVLVQSDMKCPHNHEDRLFRAEENTLDECHIVCGGTAGCNHFSWGIHNGVSVCMGCTTLENAQVHTGFNAYDLMLEPDYEFDQGDMKCPHNHEDRLFRSPASGASEITLEECHHMCKSMSGCRHFSFGAHNGGFVCMGCSSLDNAEAHSGFKTYDMNVD